MRALITGCCGFIGSHLLEELRLCGWDAIAVDRALNPLYSIPEDVPFYVGESNNRGLLKMALKDVDVVFHLAWSGIHQSSNQDVRAHVDLNLLPSIDLIEECVNAGVKKIVFMSSGGTVYGNAENLPIKENSATNPINAYGVTKLAVEKYLYFYHLMRNLNCTILRASVPYGERQNPFGLQGAVSVFMGKIMMNKPVEIFGDGKVVRDYFHVKDLAVACILAAGFKKEFSIFNIGGGSGISINELLQEIQYVTGKSVNIIYHPTRIFDAPEIVLDISKARRELNWAPSIDIRTGITSVWNWMNKEWATIKRLHG